MNISIPALSLVVLIGAPGSGKSSFARRHFRPGEVLSPAAGPAQAGADTAADALQALHQAAARRLAAGRLTVIDAANLQARQRQPLVALARAHDVPPVAIVFDARAAPAPALPAGLRQLPREGFRHVAVLAGADSIRAARLQRQPLPCDKRSLRGPFDIVGDVHGCHAELCELLHALGYQIENGATNAPGAPPALRVTPPAGRTLVFAGDLVDRGPDTPAVLRLALHMLQNGTALWAPGNHDSKLQRHLCGHKVQLTHGLADSVAQLAHQPPAFGQQVAAAIGALPSHLVLDGGRLVVAHAGLQEAYQGRHSGRVRAFALYGDTTGATDAQGLPQRRDWAASYRGRASVVYGHTPVATPRWVNRTLCIDTGCVFGGRLTALRYPEGELVSVPARRTYCHHPWAGVA